MRPGLDGTSSLSPLSSIRCECRGPAQRRWQPPKQLILTWPKGTGGLRLKRKTLLLILRRGLLAKLPPLNDPSEDHPREKHQQLNNSTVTHQGDHHQLRHA